MNRKKLAIALRELAEQQDRNAEGLRDVIGSKYDNRYLVDGAECIRILARVIEGKPLAKAFGAPGDFGYSHPIGQALAAAPDEVKREEFMECATCAAKPGSPTLCPGCLHNRDLISRLH